MDAEELRKVLMECGRMKLTEEETREFIGEEEEEDGHFLYFSDKNPAYGRQSISRPMRIVAPIPQ